MGQFTWEGNGGKLYYVDYPRDDASFAADLYRVYFHRDPDPQGQAYWSSILATGQASRPTVEQVFINTPTLEAMQARVAAATLPTTSAQPSSGNGDWAIADVPIVGPIIGGISHSTGFSPAVVGIVGIVVGLWLFSGKKW